jgi:tRNA pseudouridine13 synthase
VKIEREILVNATGNESPFEGHRALGEGSRRPLVLQVRELAVEEVREERGALRVLFVLPKGGYATTLLTCAVALQEEMVTR